MNIRFKSIFIAWIFLFFYTSAALAGSVSRVFILHSYEADNICGKPQHYGVAAALKKAGFVPGDNLLLGAYYMDTKRKNNTPQLIEEQAYSALKKIDDFKPDVLVTLDDNAFSAVALEFADTDISIVFSGLNGQPEDYSRQKKFMNSRKKPGHNITGVYEKLHIADAVRIHFRMFPKLKSIMIFTDQSPTGCALNRQIHIELEENAIPCKWQITVVNKWEEYKTAILSMNENSEIGAIYPAALLLKDDQGNTYTAPEIFKWTIQNSQQPEIAMNYEFTRQGLFGGAAIDFYSMGYQAGEMAARILKGECAGDIAIEDAVRYALVFNLKRASQLGITIPNEIILAADEVIKE